MNLVNDLVRMRDIIMEEARKAFSKEVKQILEGKMVRLNYRNSMKFPVTIKEISFPEGPVLFVITDNGGEKFFIFDDMEIIPVNESISIKSFSVKVITDRS